MSSGKNCGTCGTPLPAGMLQGLCPACLRKVAFAMPSLGDFTPQGTFPERVFGHWDPPPTSEVAALLPEGSYAVGKLIGRGGMGAVYEGIQLRLKRPVAIKLMRQDQGADEGFRLRFQREALLLASLDHPGIVKVIDCGEAGPDLLYIVMELVDGVNLMEVIRSGGVSEKRALDIVEQVCAALRFAHENGIVHRDIKPSNILLSRDGRVRIADFGLAMALDPDGHGPEDHGIGTPSYAAPEQMRADGKVDQRADLYAVGVMIYQMLTGGLPQEGWKPPSQLVAVDPAWDKIVSKALEAMPEDRIGAADEMQAMLSRISPIETARIRRRRAGSMMLVAGFLLVVGIAVLVLKRDARDESYPMPIAWVDSTEELRETARRYHFGQMEDRWLKITEDAHFDVAAGREFGDVALRVTYSGWVELGLRRTMDEAYTASMRPDGDALIYLGTTNVVEHPDVKPVKFSLGKSYDPAREHELVFAAEGDEMRLWLDGREVLSFQDRTLGKGWLHLRASVSPNPELPARILRLEYAALGGPLPPSSPPPPEFKPTPGRIAHTLTSPEFKWSPPVNLGPAVNSDGTDSGPHLSPDGLILTFVSRRNHMRRFYECVRGSADAAFGAPRMIPEVDTWSYTPWITRDRRTLVYMNPGGPGNMGSSQDLYMRQRDDASEPWGPPVNLGTVNHLGHDQSPCLSSDGLTLYFGSLRGEGYGGHDLWKATRKSPGEPFGNITNLGPTINTLIQERDMHLCSDDQTLLFVRQHNEATVSTSVLHMAVPDGRGGYHVRPLDVPIQGLMVDPCLSHDGRTLLFAWKGPSGSGDLDIWQMRRVPKDEVVTTPQPSLATVETPFANTLGMRFVPVPITGGHTDRQRVLFSVWETRVQDYAAFVKGTGRVWPPAPFEQGPAHPAVNVSWDDAQAFCRWLTACERRAGIISENEHYRLPLDREWSCAVGIGDLEAPTASPEGKNGGLPDVFLWGREWPPPPDAANFRSEECLPPPGGAATRIPEVLRGRRDPFIHTAPVGSFATGPFGLLDLAGNVREWCEDWHDAARREIRVMRGGDFTLSDGDQSMLAARLPMPPESYSSATGVRVVLGPGAGPDVKGLLPPIVDPYYPRPEVWTDLTETFKKRVMDSSLGRFENGLVHVTKQGSCPLGDHGAIGDVAVRVVLQGCVKVVLRKSGPLSCIASLERLSNGNALNAGLFQYDESTGRLSDFANMHSKLEPEFKVEEDHEIVFSAVGDCLCYWLDGELLHIIRADVSRKGTMELFFPGPEVLPGAIARIRKVEYAPL